MLKTSAAEAEACNSASRRWCVLKIKAQMLIHSITVPINRLPWSRLCRRPPRSAEIRGDVIAFRHTPRPDFFTFAFV